MTIGTILYLGIVLFICFRERKLKKAYISILALHIFICMSFEAGYFLKIDDLSIDYNIFSDIVVAAFSVLMLLYKKGLKRDYTIICTIIATVIGVIGLLVFPLHKLMVVGDTLIDRYWDGWSELSYPSFGVSCIRSLIHYLVFLVELYTAFNVLEKKDLVRLINLVSKWSVLNLGVGCVEFLLKNIFHSNAFIELVSIVFGYNSDVFTNMELRGFLYRLSGLTTEASHFSYTLFLTSLILFANYCLTLKGRWKVILAIILNVATMAFSCVLYVLIFFFIYILVKNKQQNSFGNKAVKVVAVVTIIGVVAVVLYNTSAFQNSYLGQRLQEVFNDPLLRIDISNVRNYTYTSSRIRIISMLTTLKLVIYRPLFGIGIGTTSSHGSFASIVSGLGVVGTFLWLKALFYNNGAKEFDIYKKTYNVLIALWCVAGLFVGMFWGMLYNAGNCAIIISFLVLCDKNIKIQQVFRRGINR